MRQPANPAPEHRSNRKMTKKILDRWAKQLDAHSVLLNPQIPGMFNQPTYLVVPTFGKSVAIFVSWIPRKKPYWPFILASIEDLFEVKTIAGSTTVVGGIFLNDLDEPQPLDQDMIRLLEQAFDFCYMGRVSRVAQDQDAVLRELSMLFYESEPNPRHLDLWDYERKTAQENLQQFDKRVINSLLNEGPYATRSLDEVRDEIASCLRRELDLQTELQRNVQVINIKRWFLDGTAQYAFTFDFEIPAERPILLHITRGGASKTFRRDLRSLAAQARLTRYLIDHEGELQRREADYKLWLAVASHLRGPEYDETRYMRSMIASGWHLVRADLLNIEKILGGD